MEKKYKLPEDNPEKNKLSEPAIAYHKRLSDKDIDELVLLDPNRPGIFTNEEKLNRIEQSIREMEEGIYIPHEEVILKFKDRL
ncbi:MAG: hypothetical protein LUG98_07640 [Tannerellaceae bacterium]|nr:hypothetical protein [Tannerellaceae bacterium]